MSAPDILYPPPVGGGTPVGGSGTGNTIPRWSGVGASSTLTDSIITQTGTSRITIGSGSYAGTSLDGVRLVNGVNSYFTASDGTRTSILGADGAAFVGTLTNHDFQFRANNSIAATIQASTGYVGIGTASPGAQLHVERAGGLSNAEYLRLRNTTFGAGSAVCIDQYVTANTFASGRIQHVYTGSTYDTTFSVFNTSTVTLTESMRIQGNGGNVGIGTSPDSKLHVSGAGGSSLRIGYSGTSVNYYDADTHFYRLGSGSTRFYITSSTIQFYNGATVLQTVDNNGNIYGTSGTTGMTNGFFYIPAAAGAPTTAPVPGTPPTTIAGRVPMYYDSTNNNFYVYNGGWKKVALT